MVKPRPAVVLDLLPLFDDALACGISTQLRHAVPNGGAVQGSARPSKNRPDGSFRLLPREVPGAVSPETLGDGLINQAREGQFQALRGDAHRAGRFRARLHGFC